MCTAMIVRNKIDYCSSSEDDLPLSLSKESHKFITKRDLLKSTEEKCDICDQIFFNKYSMLLHNTKHIIIPLLRQRIHQCLECNQPFITAEALKRHTFNNHLIITNKTDYVPEVIESFIIKEPYAVVNKEELPINEEEDKDITMRNEAEELLQLFVRMQPVTVLTKEPLFSEEPVSKENVLEDLAKQKSVALDPLIITIDDSDDDSTEDSCFESNNSNKIRDKILFESDCEEDKDSHNISSGIISDLTNDCNVNIEPLSNKLNGACVNNKIIIGDKLQNYCVNENNELMSRSNTIILGQYTAKEWKSVHYDELVKPGVYRCKKCNEYFPNRYTSIIHETEHIRIRKRLGFLCRLCDWYVANNRWTYNRHLLAKHPNYEYRGNKTIYGCDQCGLKYHSKKRHYLNYHPNINIKTNDAEQCNIDTVTSDECIEVKQHQEDEVATNPITNRLIKKVLKVCDLCALFFTKRGFHKYCYSYLGSISELGVRQQCENCNKMFFELKIIQCSYYYSKPDKKKQKKVLTNVDRLKSVQRRIKNMKFLNKF